MRCETVDAEASEVDVVVRTGDKERREEFVIEGTHICRNFASDRLPVCHISQVIRSKLCVVPNGTGAHIIKSLGQKVPTDS